MVFSIEFLPHGAVLSAEVDAPQTTLNTPFRQCAQALLQHCPRDFQTTIEHISKHQTAQLEVTILPSLVDKIPLLADIRSSTSTTTAGATEAEPSKKKQKIDTVAATASSKASLESECSILAVVSVLLLHEELVTVADVLGMEGVRGQVLGWLQTLLHNLAHARRRTNASVYAPPDTIHSIMRIQQVVSSIVQPQFCNELFAQLAAGEVFAHEDNMPKFKLNLADLPEEVLCIWLRCQGPTLDFSKLHLNNAQCVKLLHCIPLASLQVTALHMHGPEDARQPTQVMDDDATTMKQTVCSVHSALQALLYASTSLKGLKVLDFKRMNIHLSHLPLLHSIFRRLSDSLEQLGMSSFEFLGPSVFARNANTDSEGSEDIEEERGYSAEELQMFFQAIAKLQKLEVLKMPGWGPLVNRACMIEQSAEDRKQRMKRAVSPLLLLPALREVQVPEVDDTLPFTVEPRLKFKKATFAPCA